MLNVESINVFYGGAQALYNVSLQVSKGEIVALVGSNGAGKTTTLKTIAGLLRPSSGNIYFLNKRITNLPPNIISEKGISLVPEGRRLFPFLTVQENLEVGAYKGEARKKLKDSLELVYQLFPRLKERRNQMAYTLSGGEQQMLAIGRALMSRPKLLMLDEPSLGLAPVVYRKIFDTLKEINIQGITILLVEQNVHMALKLANRAYVMENGRIVMEGESEKLFVDENLRKAYLGI
ncbi:MAG: ABC transporter ATP-binding protein [Candidatus Bathyarchaeia archaeon]|nr:ABC transporter ATP-binding protein [Candidatus Bathyarchaeota archaeon]